MVQSLPDTAAAPFLQLPVCANLSEPLRPIVQFFSFSLIKTMAEVPAIVP